MVNLCVRVSSCLSSLCPILLDFSCPPKKNPFHYSFHIPIVLHLTDLTPSHIHAHAPEHAPSPLFPSLPPLRDPCRIVKDYKWNDEAKVTAMHVLGMPKEKGKLKSIRDLRGEHIPLLKSIRAAGLTAVEEKYGIQANMIRCYFHYLPTFYHLHVHFDHIAGGHGGHNVAKAVLLDDVIDALEVDGNHFSKASLTFQAGDVRDKKILAALDA